MPVALTKIEYAPEGGGDARVLRPGDAIPDDFPASDIEPLTGQGAIGEAWYLTSGEAATGTDSNEGDER